MNQWITKILSRTFGLLGLVMIVGGLFTSVTSATAAQDEIEFELIPKANNPGDVSENVRKLGEVGGSSTFNLKYNEYAKKLGAGGTTEKSKGGIDACAGLGNQFASGIMNRDTILCLAAQVVRFVSNMALVVGAGMIVYAGYIYATAVFEMNSGGVSEGNAAIKYAISGIVVIIFSYAILNFMINAFL